MTDSSLDIANNKNQNIGIIIILALILVAGFALRFQIAVSPLEKIIGVCLSDDAFYYLTIAENILAGHGATFDGQIQTNGFHPLYMMVCIVLKALFPGDLTVLPMLLFFALVGTINILLMYLLAKKLGGDIAGIAAAYFWAFVPHARYIELMGVEAPIMVAMILATSLWWLGIKTGRREGLKAWGILGILTGLCFLARTDAGFFALFLAADVLWTYRKSIHKNLQGILLSGMLAAATIAPWLLWNLIKFGRITQDSGRAIAFLSRDIFARSGAELFPELKYQAMIGFRDYLLRFGGISNYHITIALLVVAASAGLLFLFWKKDKHIGIWRGAPALVLAAMATWSFYNLYFMTRKFWYFLLFIAVLGLCFSRIVGLISDRAKKFRWVMAALLLLSLAYPWAQYAKKIDDVGFHNWQRIYLTVAQKIEKGEFKGIGPDDAIGAWNSGIYGAFSGHRVINLDGVVNPEALEAFKNKNIIAYAKEAGADHLIDHMDVFKIYLNNYATLNYNDALYILATIPYKGFAGDLLVLSYKDDDEKMTLQQGEGQLE